MNAISKGAAQSWQMDNRWQNMVDGKFDYGFAVDWMRKDLGIAMAEGKRARRRCRWSPWSTSSMTACRSAVADAGIRRA